MKIAVQVLFSALFTMAISGCSYSEADIYFVEPVPGDSVTVVVSSNLDTVQVATISDSLLFTFQAEIGGGWFYAAYASVDNELIYTYNADYDPDTINGPFVFSDSFWIRQDLDVGPGMSFMLFEFYHSANTNSLADLAGIETGSYELEYEILLEGGDK